MIRCWLGIAIGSLLLGCGFQLKGDSGQLFGSDSPFQQTQIVIEPAPNTEQMTIALRRALAKHLRNTSSEEVFVLRVDNERITRPILTRTNTGRPGEYQISISVSVSHDALWMGDISNSNVETRASDNQSISSERRSMNFSAQRYYVYDNTRVAAANARDRELLDLMRRDLAQQILAYVAQLSARSDQ